MEDLRCEIKQGIQWLALQLCMKFHEPIASIPLYTRNAKISLVEFDCDGENEAERHRRSEGSKWKRSADDERRSPEKRCVSQSTAATQPLSLTLSGIVCFSGNSCKRTMTAKGLDDDDGLLQRASSSTKQHLRPY